MVKIKDWLNDVSKVFLPPFETKRFRQFSPSDVFIGYHDDAPASIVLRNSENINNDIVEQAKITFLACATPDAISRFVPSLYLPSQTPLSSQQLVSKVTNHDVLAGVKVSLNLNLGPVKQETTCP